MRKLTISLLALFIFSLSSTAQSKANAEPVTPLTYGISQQCVDQYEKISKLSTPKLVALFQSLALFYQRQKLGAEDYEGFLDWLDTKKDCDSLENGFFITEIKQIKTELINRNMRGALSKSFLGEIMVNYTNSNTEVEVFVKNKWIPLPRTLP